MRTRFLAIPLSVLVQVTPGCVGQLPADPPAEASAGLDGAADPSIYFDFDDPDDPYRELYAEFRARRARDMSDPNKPPPVERYPAVHFTRGMSWSALEEVFPFDWPALRATSPDEASQLEASVRARLALDHPDLKIVQVMLGPDALLPTHADGAPGVLIVVGGRGEITVEGETQLAEPGTTVKLAPYDTRRVAAVGDTPFRLLWIRWAPDGDQAYIDAGYYLTGANQHNQPESADMPMDYSFWGAEYGVSPLHEPTLAVSPPVDGEHSGAAARGLAHARSALGEGRDLYPDVPRFGHESDREWLSVETLKSGGFFFSRDVGKMGAIVDRMARIARHKAIFRATRPDGDWDFNISETAWGPRSTYVEHSHLIPEFYYVMAGPVIYGVDGERHRVVPGDIILNNSYAPHFAQGIVDGMPFDNFGSTWAPNGDRSVFERPFFLVEPLRAQPATAALPTGVAFH